MRSHLFLYIILLFCFSTFSMDLIDNAYNSGSISIYEKALLKALYILDYENLPDIYKTAEIHPKRCATHQLMEIASILHNAPKDYKYEYDKISQRPTFDKKAHKYLSSQGNFLIHYTGAGHHAPDLTDANMSGIPDQIEEIAELFELSYHMFHYDLNYLYPPSDGTAGGLTDVYDVYIKNWPGYYGYAMPEGFSNDMPEYSTRTISYIGISSWVTGADLRGTIAHEYYHACQMAYYCDYHAYSSWAWDENTAMYTEKLVFPDDNVWLDYTGHRQNHPFYGLWRFDGWTEYSNVIWPLFIREGIVSYDDTFFRTVYEHLGLLTTPGSGGLYPSVLNSLLPGFSLSEAYQIFTVWNYLVKDCFDGTSYEDGQSFLRRPKLTQTIYYHDLPFYSPQNESPPETHASNYIKIYPKDDDNKALVINITAGPMKNPQWGYSILCHNRDYPLSNGWTLYDQTIIKDNISAHIVLHDPGRFDRIVIIVDNLRFIEELTEMTYSYSIELH